VRIRNTRNADGTEETTADARFVRLFDPFFHRYDRHPDKTNGITDF
jgi:hypothetical protein